MNEIEIREFKKMKLNGATVIDGLPSISLVNTIAANYLVAALKLDHIAALDSDQFPSISMIYNFKPKFPARIYASEEYKIVIFLSEFRISPNLYRPLAKTIFYCTKKQNCSLIISPVEWSIESFSIGKLEPFVQGIGSTDRARERLASNEVQQLEFGAIPGISGLLLNEGRWSNFDVISLIVPVYPNMPSVKAAVKAVEVIDKLIPEIEIDITPLYQEAEKIENKLRTLRRQAQPKESEPPSEVYR